VREVGAPNVLASPTQPRCCSSALWSKGLF